MSVNLYCHETVPVILQFSSNTLFNQSINDMNIDTNNRSNQLVSRSHYDIKGSVSQTYTFQVFPSDSIQNVNRPNEPVRVYYVPFLYCYELQTCMGQLKHP